MQSVPLPQQLRVPPHPSWCPQPALPKSAHVLGVHVTHWSITQVCPVAQLLQTLITPQLRLTGLQPVGLASASAHVSGVQHVSTSQTCPVAHPAQTLFTPQFRLTGAQPVTMPASAASAHVSGVQQPPSSHVSVPGHVPQETFGPQPLLTSPQTMLPQLGGVHAVQVPPVQVVLPMQLPHCTLPLPHAFSIDPHFDPVPPSPPMHSGGGGLHTPPMHSCPEGHEH